MQFEEQPCRPVKEGDTEHNIELLAKILKEDRTNKSKIQLFIDKFILDRKQAEQP